MNKALTQQFIREEVEATLIIQMAPLKSPGLDGFNLNFYQTYWHIVRDEVTSVVLKFLNEDIFDKCVNFNYISLIPKIKSLVSAYGFCPTNLCNVVYKFASY